MNKSALNLQSLKQKFIDLAQAFMANAVVVFVVFIALLYGFLLLRINMLSAAQPSTDAIAAQTNPVHSTHIDKNAVKQLQQLQDNNVSVKTLFTQARDNPFEE